MQANAPGPFRATLLATPAGPSGMVLAARHIAEDRWIVRSKPVARMRQGLALALPVYDRNTSCINFCKARQCALSAELRGPGSDPRERHHFSEQGLAACQIGAT
jgi:hypothetical protein